MIKLPTSRCTASFLIMSLKELVKFQWNSAPVETEPMRCEFTQSKVYYSYGGHHRSYDDWFTGLRTVEELSPTSLEFLTTFNNRAQSRHTSASLEVLLDKVNFQEIENCYCLWAYVDREGNLACERDINVIFAHCTSGLRFVTDELVHYERMTWDYQA